MPSLLKAWLCSGLGWGILFFILAWQMANAVSVPWYFTFQLFSRHWLLWTFVTPLIYQLVNWEPIERDNWKIAVLKHLCACLAFLLIFDLVGRSVPPPVPDSPVDGESFAPPALGFIGELIFRPDLPIYLVILSVSHALYFYRREKEKELRSAELVASLAEARLSALRMQIQPHFLFNSLNALGTLIHKDTNAADKMLMGLADFLRLTLQSFDTQQVPLAQELDYARRYLDIERTRFGDRLAYTVEAPLDLHAALVPSLILQPLIENAVRHGIEPKREGGRIFLTAARDKKSLRLSVRDTGVGLKDGFVPGVGLANTRERLRETYGANASLQLVGGEGTSIEIRLPLSVT